MKKLLSVLLVMVLLWTGLLGGVLAARADGMEPPPVDDPQGYLQDVIAFYDLIEWEMLLPFLQSAPYRDARAALDALQGKAGLTVAEVDAAQEVLLTLLDSGAPVFATYGDVNRDGYADNTDARLVLQFEVRLIDMNRLDWARADVSDDRVVDSTDARLVLQFEVGLIRRFPADEASDSNGLENLKLTMATMRAQFAATRDMWELAYGPALVAELFANLDAFEALLYDEVFLTGLDARDAAAITRLADTTTALCTTFVRLGLMDEANWNNMWASLQDFGVTPSPYPAV